MTGNRRSGDAANTLELQLPAPRCESRLPRCSRIPVERVQTKDPMDLGIQCVLTWVANVSG